mmetsp:Transcript_6145/g.11732  ORF Transcript_6145/g.11732 Transcript_6145/m.11732 type:complete len:782 (-) Transcript_6145:209-2554(-)
MTEMNEFFSTDKYVGDEESPRSPENKEDYFPLEPIATQNAWQAEDAEKTKISYWLTLESDLDKEQLYSFLLLRQTSTVTAIVVSIMLTIVFALYLTEHLSSNSEANLGEFVLALQFVQFTSTVFSWLYLYFSMSAEPSPRKATFCADQFILWTSVAGALIIIIRCMNGACRDDQLGATCNPRHADNGVPADCLVANLLMIALLPVIFKAHKTSWVFLSYFVTLLGLIVAAIIADASSDISMIVVASFGFGIMIYEYERNMITMFLLIQSQHKFYDRVRAGESAKVSAEMEKDELRSIIGSVAHDLKTPLHALMGEIDGLQIEVDAVKQQLLGLTLLQDPVVTTHVDIISTRTTDALKCISSLRDIYQFMVMAINRAIEFRKTAAGLALLASRETFHLAKAVNWAVGRFSSNPSGVDIRVEMCPTLDEACPYLITDKHWMTENILTLLSNACKFTSKGEIVLRVSLTSEAVREDVKSDAVRSSRLVDKISSFSEIGRSVVSFETGPTSREHVSVEWMAEHPDAEYFVVIEVEDTGIGVQPDAVHNLFQLFGKCQQRAGGTGLGLFALSKRTEVLGGRCGMHKREDGGSGCCFWFSYPYVPDWTAWHELKIVSEVDGLSPRNPTLSPKHSFNFIDNATNEFEEHECVSSIVLVVDDSSLILKTTKRMLVKEGYEVETAQNGEEALHLMESKSYLFVLSDIQMPVMDGLEMAQRIRQYEKDGVAVDEGEGKVEVKPRHLIVGMSANSDAETRDESLASGMDAFIPKPVRMTELVKHIPALHSES